MRPRTSNLRPLATCLALSLLLPALPAVAAEATLTLLPEVGVWNEPIAARIEGVGCSGAFDPPIVDVSLSVRTIDIDLRDCGGDPDRPFSIVVPLGPLFPGDYLVRAQDAIRNSGLAERITPPPPPLDTAPLSVRHAADLDLELPETATDAAPVTLTAIVLASSSCFTFFGPEIHDRVVELFFEDNCPVLPLPGEGVFRIPVSLGLLSPGRWDVRFHHLGRGDPADLALRRATLVVHDAEGCVPSDAVLCLAGGRFRVEAAWTDFRGRSGPGHARPLDGDGASGLVWFFDRQNVELTVKMLNGCGINGHWWFFLSSGSTVEYTVTVTDTAPGGGVRTYTNASGLSAPLVSDTSAFLCLGG